MHLRSIIGPVESTFFDSMHCLTASSGMFQFEVNQFVKDVLKEHKNMKVEVFDDFSQQINWCHKDKLHKNFFENRIQQKPGSHIKAFAGEVMMAMRVLLLFSERVLVPQNSMPGHCECLSLAVQILEIIEQGDDAVQLARELSSLTVKHHKCSLAVYGEELRKQKSHLFHHVPLKIEELEVNMTCFPGERRHALTKLIAEIKHGRGFEMFIIRKVSAVQLEANLSSPCAEIFLRAPITLAPKLYGLLEPMQQVHVSKSIQTKFGVLLRKQLLLLVAERPVIGVAQFFARSGQQHWVCIAECVHASGGLWRQSDSVAYVDVICLQSVLPYCVSGDSGELMRPLVPVRLRKKFFAGLA